MSKAKQFIHLLGLTDSPEKDLIIKEKNGKEFSLSNMLDMYAKTNAHMAWEESRWSLAKENGEDVSDLEEDGPIAKNLDEYLERIFG